MIILQILAGGLIGLLGTLGLLFTAPTNQNNLGTAAGANISYTKHLLPTADDTWDIGTSSLAYRNAFIGVLTVDSCTGCSGASTADFQDAYNNSAVNATILSADGKELVYIIADTTDPAEFVISAADQGSLQLNVGSTTNQSLFAYGAHGIGTTSPGGGLALSATSTILGNGAYVYGQLTAANVVATSTNSGFGTSSPYAPLSVEIQAGSKIPSFVVSDQGTSSPIFTVLPSGRIGIGTQKQYGTAKILVLDENGSNSDFAYQVYGGGFPVIYLQSAEGTSEAPTRSLSNGTGGSLVFEGYNGISFETIASIVAELDGSGIPSDTPGSLVFNVSNRATSNLDEILRLDGNFHVGFASNSPYAFFSIENPGGNVVGSSTPIFVIGDEGTSTPLLQVNWSRVVSIATATDNGAESLNGFGLAVATNTLFGGKIEVTDTGTSTTLAGTLAVEGTGTSTIAGNLEISKSLILGASVYPSVASATIDTATTTLVGDCSVSGITDATNDGDYSPLFKNCFGGQQHMFRIDDPRHDAEVHQLNWLGIVDANGEYGSSTLVNTILFDKTGGSTTTPGLCQGYMNVFTAMFASSSDNQSVKAIIDGPRCYGY